ncbi:MAG: NAD(P)H-dependent oxidoreductase [Planctomycetota bacterium]
MNVLIVHAHHEPKSFSSALKDQAIDSLQRAGHDVVVSNLYKMDFDPVSDRRNFTTVKNEDYLKQQAEEAHASETGGFSTELEKEIRKLEAADAVIFSYPLWWFGVPAILKGWIDRVLVAGRIYGGSKLYESGVGGGTKRGMVLMTTGGGPDVYGGWGVNPSLVRRTRYD